MKQLALWVLFGVLLALLVFVLRSRFWGPGAGNIHEAAREGKVARVTKLLAADPELVNARDIRSRWTPLQWAVYGGHKDVAQLLLEKGADVNVDMGTPATPLDMAAQQGDEEMVALLRKHAAKQ